MKKTNAVATIVIGAAWLALAVHAAEPSAQPATQPSTSPATQPSSQPGKELVLDLGNKVTMKLVLIPAGKFIMGSPKEEKDRFDNEGPQREVTLTKPFYMGVYEVRQDQWTAVMGTTPWKNESRRGNGKVIAKEGATNATSCISWNDAAEFCKKLATKTGRTVGLPTEAQWEYACRAGSTTRFSFGDDADYSQIGDYAWYSGNAKAIDEEYAHAVGQKKPNAWGLYDMHGNVYEYIADWWCDDDKNYYTNAGKVDPTGPVSGRFRQLRGGSFSVNARNLKSADRNPTAGLGVSWYGHGCRVVVESN